MAAMLVDVGQIFNGLGQINVEISCPPIRSLWFQLVNDGKKILWWQWRWQWRWLWRWEIDDSGYSKSDDSDNINIFNEFVRTTFILYQTTNQLT